jgi:hypothetical protein
MVRRRRRWPLVLAVILVVVVVVGGVYWMFAQRQARIEGRALGQAAEEVAAADARLREAAADLPGEIERAESTLLETAAQLGEESWAAQGLDQALDVARKFMGTVGRNPSDPPLTRVAADSMLREDEDQLALIGPVKSNLVAAENTAREAVDGALLATAVSDLAAARAEVSTVVADASEYEVRLDTRARRIASRLKLDLPLLVSPPVELPADASKKEVRRGERMNAMFAGAARLSTAVTSAVMVRDAVVDNGDIEAVKRAIGSCAEARKTLKSELKSVQSEDLL